MTIAPTTAPTTAPILQLWPPLSGRYDLVCRGTQVQDRRDHGEEGGRDQVTWWGWLSVIRTNSV
jgi:hypothetical protein